MAITAKDVHWSLSDIRDKVRKLSGRPSTNQISDNSVDEYVNRFYTQDLPALLQMRDLTSFWRFATLPNVPNYSDLGDNYNLSGPALVNGSPIEIIRDPGCFYERYPQTFQTQENVGTGDGATVNFTGTLGKSSISQENFVIDDDVERLVPKQRIKITNITKANPAVVTTDVAHGLSTVDTAQIIDMIAGMEEINDVSDTITVLTTTTFQLDNVNSTNFKAYLSGGNVFPTSVVILSGSLGGSGRITVSTGAYDVTFGSAPASGQALRANYEFFNTGIPVAALFYQRELSFSPVPDAPYFVQVGVSGRPAPLLADSDPLAFNDWGKLVAYGAAIDLLNDLGQQDTSQLLEQQFKRLLSQARSRDLREMETVRAAPRF